jgi:hypothetical protein
MIRAFSVYFPARALSASKLVVVYLAFSMALIVRAGIVRCFTS